MILNGELTRQFDIKTVCEGTPPDDTGFLITRLWDKYLPAWRDIKAAPKKPRDPEADKKLIEELNQMSDLPDLRPHDERDPDKINYYDDY